MARYLLIEFDNDAQCDSLRAKIDTASEAGKPFRVRGMYQRPVRWCGCPKSTAYRDKDRFAIGERFGWWVCRECRRARVGSHQLKNLIPVDQLVWIAETYADVANWLHIFEVPADNIINRIASMHMDVGDITEEEHADVPAV